MSIAPDQAPLSSPEASDSYGARVNAAIRRCAAGEPAGLAALYDATGTWVYTVARRASADDEQACTLVMDVYRDAWSHSGSVDLQRSCGVGWLLHLLACRVRRRSADG